MSEEEMARAAGPDAARVAAWLDAMAGPLSPTDDAARIDLIASLEQLKSAASALQARVTVAFTQSQLAEQKAAGVRTRDLGRGISAQVGLARRESPHKAARLVGLAEALVNEMPHTLAAMAAGSVSEWRATIVAQQIGCLSPDDRATVDAQLGGRLGSLSDRHAQAEAARLAYQLDPHTFLERAVRAETDRRVTLRPAPDTMSVLSGLLPLVGGVAVYATLTRDADARRAAGDQRSRGQIMADLLIERVTGLTNADQAPVEVQLLISDDTLLAGGDTPARVNGYGPVPAPYARRLLRRLDDDTHTWLRRLYTNPETGRLTGMESTRRTFSGTLRHQIIIRDEICRTPWCGAPIRHLDHPIPIEAGGPTSEPNGQGLCEACNYAKQASGWQARPGPGGAGESVQITTPTGHTHTSYPPPNPKAWVTSRWLPPIEIYYIPHHEKAA